MQKWLLAIFIGFFFLICSSAIFYALMNRCCLAVGLPSTMTSQGPTLFGLILATVLFVIGIRLIVLW